jgi:uncharacterized membrane-anchored protein YitT (DUF2179 family)
MEQIIRNSFGDYGYFIIPIIAGILISFVAEALNKITPKVVSNHVLLFCVNIVVTIQVLFVFPSYFQDDIAELIFAFVLNLSFSYVFYYTLGQKVVRLIMKNIEHRIDDKIDDKIDEIVDEAIDKKADDELKDKQSE